MDGFVVRGRFVHAVGAPGELELIEDGCVVVGEDGIISHVAKTPEAVELHIRIAGQRVITMDGTQFCVPGMIDTHVHAPQYQYTGTATDLPLMQWLQAYTFPAEKRCEDTAYAARVYGKLVRRLLSAGTTTAVYYGSIHLEATKALVDACRTHGQRAIVGKVAMDQHGAEGYEETTEASLRDTEALIEYCYACEPGAADGPHRLVNPAVTPRFIPTCTDALLEGLGRLAAKHRARGCWVQSHLAEASRLVSSTVSGLISHATSAHHPVLVH